MEKQTKPRDKTSEKTFERPKVVIRFRKGLNLFHGRSRHLGGRPWCKGAKPGKRIKRGKVYDLPCRLAFDKPSKRTLRNT